ncbi:unnamed protein product [Amoebophrya sp. A120]|nr:unnamed protein product [Amoebophrya sp. A120]|eukprot:GSA120T00009297001.1
MPDTVPEGEPCTKKPKVASIEDQESCVKTAAEEKIMTEEQQQAAVAAASPAGDQQATSGNDSTIAEPDAAVQEKEKSARARWPALESNPETFTDFIHKLGAPQNIAIHDVFGFDPELLMMLPQPVYAMIFLFPPKSELLGEREKKTEDLPQPEGEPFFLWQSKALGNACGTIAAIHSLINNRSSLPFTDDSILGQFVTATKDHTPGERGKIMETFEPMRKQQQKAASGRSNQTEMTEGKVDFHFVAFVEKNNAIWELDGARPKPRKFAMVEGLSFGERVGQIIQSEYMAKMPGEHNFSTLALAPAME